MTLDEFRRHPAYDYYIRTLVSNCLVCDKECRCLKGVKLEDVTPELEQKAFKEMK